MSPEAQMDFQFSGSNNFKNSSLDSIKGSSVCSLEENDVEERDTEPPPCEDEKRTELLASGVQDQLSVSHTTSEGNSGHPSQVCQMSQLEEGEMMPKSEFEWTETTSEVMSSSNPTAAMAATTSKLNKCKIDDEQSRSTPRRTQSTGGSSPATCVLGTSFSTPSTTLEEGCGSMIPPIAPEISSSRGTTVGRFRSESSYYGNMGNSLSGMSFDNNRNWRYELRTHRTLGLSVYVMLSCVLYVRRIYVCVCFGTNGLSIQELSISSS